MLRVKNILVTIMAFVLTAFTANAQMASSQSRLDIGKNASPVKANTKPLSSYVLTGELSSEIKVNSNSAINDFYRNLLIKNNQQKVALNANPNYTSERVALDKLYMDKDISVSNIYPNPANDFAAIDFRIESSSKQVKISFHNLLGGSVGEYELDSFDRSLRISTREWDNGIYFYQLLIDGKKMATKKLLVRHH